jgi:hypothetical protein
VGEQLLVSQEGLSSTELVIQRKGRTITESVSCRLSTAAARVSIPGHVGFVVNKVALEQDFSEYFTLPYQYSFHQMHHTHL